jgi:hypothetical protein
MPTLRFSLGSRVIETPSMVTSPAVGSMKPARMLRAVVFPDPDGPRKVTNSPAATSRLKSASATTSP